MAENEDRGIVAESDVNNDNTNGIEAKRNKIRFRRATEQDTREAFGDNSTTTEIGRPRRQRQITEERKASVSVSDTRPAFSEKVKGKPPTLPEEKEVSSEKRKVGRPSKAPIYPSFEDSTAQAKFLLSGLEVACITARGPIGEMTDWERGVLQGPLQRRIAAIPISVLQKGGLLFDIGFLGLGMSIYFTRVFRGVSIPRFGKPKVNEIQEDKESPVAAAPEQIVQRTTPGDRDGLAVPVPNIISQYMNSAI